MMKLLKYGIRIVIICTVILNVLGCNQSPVRNPFAGRHEPKLGELPALSEKKQVNVAKVSWSNSTLAKQHRFTKLSPFVSAQTIYAADHTGKVVALNRQSGKKIWSQSTGKKYTAGPSLMGSTLLLATSDAKVVALDAQSGHLLWETKVSSEVLATPTGEKDIVLVHAIDGSVCALDGRNGEQLWSVNQSTPSLTLRYSSAAAIVDDVALVGFSSGKLLALNLNSGLIGWERTISQPRGRSELQRMVDISADPIIVGDNVYVITYQGKLAAVNIASGDLVWEREVSSYHNMAIKDDKLFVTDNSHCLWSIDRHTGNTLWKQDSLAERYITGPVVVDGLLVVADRGGYVHMLSSENGHLLNRMHLSGKFYQDPKVMGNQLFVSSHRGKIASILVSGSAA